MPRGAGAAVRMRAAGERGLVVEMGETIDPRVNGRVRALGRALAARMAGEGIEVVPTYRSLLVVHDPLRVGRARVRRLIEELLRELPEPEEERGPGRLVQVPACYGGSFGPDLEEVSRLRGLSPDEVASIHSSCTYLVHMLGFTPGFPYLGGMDARIAAPRLAAPRPRVPAGSIGIAGEQTGIYPLPSPGGWRIVARTPLRLFDPGREPPFLFTAGDRVRFTPVGPEEFDALARDAASCLPTPPSAGKVEGKGEAPRPSTLRREGSERGGGGRTAIAVEQPGLLTTIQDQGRPGYRAFGMPAGGALDARAYALANLLAGNAPGAAAVEMTLRGATFRFERDAYVAVAGADMRAELDGACVETWSAFPVRAGGVLRFSGAAEGCRTYLAVQGGIDVPPVLGSRSTYARAGVGGLGGRPLARGDVLPVGSAPPRSATPRRLGARFVPRRGRGLSLRVLLGPQDDRFSREGVATLLGSAYSVTDRNDRMGYQLDGPAIRHARGPDIVSDGLLPGAVQVPGSGMPIVMMADCPTVGGYAKIAFVVAADLPDLAQARRGDTVRFARCTLREATAALRRERALLEAAAMSLGHW
jgi:KipI family sensor histidine kinase inhibitor